MAVHHANFDGGGGPRFDDWLGAQCLRLRSRARRRSARVRNAAPEFDGSAVDALADDEDLGGAAKRRKASSGDRVAAGPAGAGVWASEDAALEASRAWLEGIR